MKNNQNQNLDPEEVQALDDAHGVIDSKKLLTINWLNLGATMLVLVILLGYVTTQLGWWEKSPEPTTYNVAPEEPLAPEAIHFSTLGAITLHGLSARINGSKVELHEEEDSKTIITLDRKYGPAKFLAHVNTTAVVLKIREGENGTVGLLLERDDWKGTYYLGTTLTKPMYYASGDFIPWENRNRKFIIEFFKREDVIVNEKNVLLN